MPCPSGGIKAWSCSRCPRRGVERGPHAVRESEAMTDEYILKGMIWLGFAALLGLVDLLLGARRKRSR